MYARIYIKMRKYICMREYIYVCANIHIYKCANIYKDARILFNNFLMCLMSNGITYFYMYELYAFILSDMFLIIHTFSIGPLTE